MSTDWVITVRSLRNGRFGAEPGPTRFLRVPAGEDPDPAHRGGKRAWVDELIAAAHTGADPLTGKGCGDIAVLVHGYSTSPAEILARHRSLRTDLAAAGYRGQLVSYDWPSDDHAFNYLEDRVDAKLTALKFVDDGIALLAAAQYRGCEINVHVIAHSMGCYVVREAFDDADDRPAIAASNWNVSQVCFLAADVSSASLAADDARSRSLYRHCTRLTNYQNPYDAVLKLLGRETCRRRPARRPPRTAREPARKSGQRKLRRRLSSRPMPRAATTGIPAFPRSGVRRGPGADAGRNRDRRVVSARRSLPDGTLALA